MRNNNSNIPVLNFTTYSEILLQILLVFLVIMSLSRIAKQNEADPALAQNVVYQVFMDWEGESATDMDLWAKDPTGNIVGFNNREGGENSLFSLAHDDLGNKNDVVTSVSSVAESMGVSPPQLPGMVTPPLAVPSGPSVSSVPPNAPVVKVNQEIISFRAMKEGEYVINGHCYAKKPMSKPDKVKCKLIKIKPFKEVKVIEREFKVNGDEITFFRFKVDKDGNILEVNELPDKFVQLNKQADVGDEEPMQPENN